MSRLTLYYFESCPFCQRVLSYLKEASISIPMKDILVNPVYKQELFKIAGRTQVPCLVIDGKALYESDDIIQWFKDNRKKS